MKKIKMKSDCFLWVVMLVPAVLAFILAFNGSMNFDEFFCMNWTKLSWGEMWEELVHDVHPPLYYLGLKLWLTIFGEGIFAARIYSLLAFYGMLLLALFVRKQFGLKNAFWYLFLLCGNPFMLQKATEIRMYTWAGIWTLLNGAFLYLLMKDGRRRYWVGFCLSGLLAAYNHYFALLIMVVTYLGLGIFCFFSKNKKKIRSWFFLCLITAAGYLPWLGIALSQVTQVNDVYWIEWPDSRLGVVRDLFYNAFPNTEKIYMLLILLLPLLAAVLLIFEKKKARAWWELVVMSAFWAVWLFGMGYMELAQRPILVSRYLIMGMLLLILGSSSIARKLPLWLMIALCAFFTLVGGEFYSRLLKLQLERTTETTVAFAEEHIGEGDRICYLNDGYGYLNFCVNYYIPWAEAVNLGEDDALESDFDGRTWFLESDRMLEDERNEVMKADMEYMGEYAFGTETFRVYAEAEKPE